MFSNLEENAILTNFSSFFWSEVLPIFLHSPHTFSATHLTISLSKWWQFNQTITFQLTYLLYCEVKDRAIPSWLLHRTWCLPGFLAPPRPCLRRRRWPRSLCRTCCGTSRPSNTKGRSRKAVARPAGIDTLPWKARK